MLTLNTAIGIAVRGEDLEFLCLKKRLRGLEAGGWMRLEKYRALRPAEAGQAYREFLLGQGLSTANAMVALPRGQALLRVLTLPAEAGSNLAKAIEYQVDSLHPFEEGGVDYDYAVLRRDEGRLQVAVVMVEKKAAGEYHEWFSRAGIPVAGFTLSTAALFHAAAATPSPFFVADACGGRIELLGLSSDTFTSREFADAPGALDREMALARAEMRLPPEAEVAIIRGGTLAPDEETSRLVVRGAARAALDGHAFQINLLPPERRVYRSPWTYVPTYALAGVVGLLALATLARGPLQDRLYLNRLNAETRRLESKVKYVEKLETKQRKIVDRVVTLNSVKAVTAAKIEALAELTRQLPNTVWLQEADFREGSLTIQGQADSAPPLLGTLSASPRFRNPEFLSSITKNPEGKDMFRIRMRLSGQLPQLPVASDQNGGRP